MREEKEGVGDGVLRAGDKAGEGIHICGGEEGRIGDTGALRREVEGILLVWMMVSGDSIIKGLMVPGVRVLAARGRTRCWIKLCVCFGWTG